MKTIRLFIVKTIRFILVQFKRGGSMPGKIALRMDDNILMKFKTPKMLILVTGTNGKTTTSNLIVESLSNAGLKVIGNRRGDNLREGIVTLLCAHSDYAYRVHADAIVLEVDELTIPRVFHQLKVSTFVVNNFFRDQLDRAGEMETILRKIESVLPEYQGDLILNGSDPNVMRLKDKAPLAKAYNFQVARVDDSTETSTEASEGKFCPRCQHALIYEYYQYSHIGKFHCDFDSFSSGDADVFVEAIDYENQSFVVDGVAYHSFQNAIYGIYNCAAVLCCLKSLNIDTKYAQAIFANYELNDGRNEVFMIQGERCVLNLIKNPTGANEVIKGLLRDKEAKAVMIVLNDKDQDGCDVSWIWDAHFDLLLNEQIEMIICSGLRAYDMALRLKVQGYDKCLIVEEDIEVAIKKLNECHESSVILSTYTALQVVRSILRRLS